MFTRFLRQDNTLVQQITFGAAPSQTPSDSSIAEFVQEHWVIDGQWTLDGAHRTPVPHPGPPKEDCYTMDPPERPYRVRLSDAKTEIPAEE
jgi:hypothetical protein